MIANLAFDGHERSTITAAFNVPVVVEVEVEVEAGVPQPLQLDVVDRRTVGLVGARDPANPCLRAVLNYQPVVTREREDERSRFQCGLVVEVVLPDDDRRADMIYLDVRGIGRDLHAHGRGDLESELEVVARAAPDRDRRDDTEHAAVHVAPRYHLAGISIPLASPGCVSRTSEFTITSRDLSSGKGGVDLEPILEGGTQVAMRIVGVREGTTAARLGARNGDTIVSLNDLPLSSVAEARGREAAPDRRQGHA
ncbi:MAG: hypothetical protein ABI867_15010 [Kofleriaceae bacterium]